MQEEQKTITNMPHECDFSNPSGSYGPAIDGCWEQENGELWVGNGEYASQINYCPECGYEAKVKCIKSNERKV